MPYANLDSLAEPVFALISVNSAPIPWVNWPQSPGWLT